MSTKNYIKAGTGLQKIKTLINLPKTIMLATKLHKVPFSICPMTLLQMDDQGDLWFFTSKESEHFTEISHDNRVQIMYLDDDKQNYISIYGNATHIVDEAKIDELWTPILSNWFEGPSDSNLALLNVNMENAYYWDTNLNKLMSFFELIEGGNSEKGDKGFVDLRSY